MPAERHACLLASRRTQEQPESVAPADLSLPNSTLTHVGVHWHVCVQDALAASERTSGDKNVQHDPFGEGIGPELQVRI